MFVVDDFCCNTAVANCALACGLVFAVDDEDNDEDNDGRESLENAAVSRFFFCLFVFVLPK